MKLPLKGSSCSVRKTKLLSQFGHAGGKNGDPPPDFHHMQAVQAD
jgi:hypothetical protein